MTENVFVSSPGGAVYSNLMDVENGSDLCLNHLRVLKITCLGKTEGTFFGAELHRIIAIHPEL